MPLKKECHLELKISLVNVNKSAIPYELFHFAGTYLEPSQTCKIELFAKIVIKFKKLTISAKNSILTFDCILNAPLNCAELIQ